MDWLITLFVITWYFKVLNFESENEDSLYEVCKNLFGGKEVQSQ